MMPKGQTDLQQAALELTEYMYIQAHNQQQLHQAGPLRRRFI